MKVLLTHGYFINEDEKEQKIMRPYPPLGLLYISAFLEENNIENEIFDSTFSSKKSLYDKIDQVKPDVIAIYTNLMTKINVIQIATHIKQYLPDCTVILGGPDVTYNIENYLSNGADIVVVGEGENTMLELVNEIEQSPNPNLRNIDGLAFIENNQVVKTNARTKTKDLDELPIPNRKAIDLSLYLNAWKEFHGSNALNVSTQRGCPYTCKWCSTAVYGQSYRRRSPQKVLDEVQSIMEQYQPDHIWFVDDVFTVSHKWLEEFTNLVEKNKIKFSFECITRADRLNPEVIKLLKRSGCFRVWIGAESGSQKIIDAMDRRVSVDKVSDMIISAKSEGIQTGTFIMLGYPGEDMNDIKDTIHHLKKSQPDHFTITVAYPIKGTSLYQEIEDRITKQPQWTTSTDREIDFKRTYPRKFYNHAVSHVVNEVNFHKNRMSNGLMTERLKYKAKSLYALLKMKTTQVRK